ncbi:MAG TPA: hypothetical protein VGP62_10195 [Bryobacteraceae bacterium]|nr:hypothetical protein [Bryobacteraceae bacterium]
MRTLGLLSLAFLIASISTVRASAKDEGFSGRWVLDKSQPSPNAPDNLEIRIKQDGSGVSMECTFKEPENGIVPLLYLGIMTSKMHLSLDGNAQQNQIGPFQMASKTTLNGNQMDTEWTAAVKDDQVQGHWKHTLSDDGRHMTLEIKESSTQGQSGQATLHFVRK